MVWYSTVVFMLGVAIVGQPMSEQGRDLIFRNAIATVTPPAPAIWLVGLLTCRFCSLQVRGTTACFMVVGGAVGETAVGETTVGETAGAVEVDPLAAGVGLVRRDAQV